MPLSDAFWKEYRPLAKEYERRFGEDGMRLMTDFTFPSDEEGMLAIIRECLEKDKDWQTLFAEEYRVPGAVY